jgi:hypothetical protein
VPEKSMPPAPCPSSPVRRLSREKMLRSATDAAAGDAASALLCSGTMETMVSVTV